MVAERGILGQEAIASKPVIVLSEASSTLKSIGDTCLQRHEARITILIVNGPLKDHPAGAQSEYSGPTILEQILVRREGEERGMCTAWVWHLLLSEQISTSHPLDIRAQVPYNRR